MISRMFHVILLILSFESIYSLRKIKDGKNVTTDMNYMVYLVKANQSKQQYDAWICGGVIVSSEYIVTSAACVEDVEYMYAIAGYKNYVNNDNVETDECAKNSRKKIVFTCVPKGYNLTYDKIEKWAFIDIAVVQVESPYDFNTPIPGCTWVPRRIDINYDPKYQTPGTDAMVLGWGHADKWRSPGDTKDYNQGTLQYGSILVMSKEECKASYSSQPELLPIIEQYMICADHEGNIDEKGDFMVKVTPRPNQTDGCAPGTLRIGRKCQPNHVNINYQSYETPNHAQLYKTQAPLRGHPANTYKNIRPVDIGSRLIFPMKTRPTTTRSSNANSQFNSGDDITFDDILALNSRRTYLTKNGEIINTRKAGICQNDHGGPLVTWAGKHEILIGIASVFRINKESQCVGPYLFTSTQCNGAFLHCILSQAPDETTNKKALKPASKSGENTKPESPVKKIEVPEQKESPVEEHKVPNQKESVVEDPQELIPRGSPVEDPQEPIPPEPPVEEPQEPKPLEPPVEEPQEPKPLEPPVEEPSQRENFMLRQAKFVPRQSKPIALTTRLRYPRNFNHGRLQMAPKGKQFLKLNFGHTYRDPGRMSSNQGRSRIYREPYGKLLKASHGQPPKRRTDDFCNLPAKEKGFQIIERRISWRDHPDGPAMNELDEDLFFRPVQPFGTFNG